MTSTFRQWLRRLWLRQIDPSLAVDYQMTFTTLQGQKVLQHLLDSVYCTIYTGKDPMELAYHNGRRSLMQEVLENIDMGVSPRKYELTQEGATGWPTNQPQS